MKHFARRFLHSSRHAAIIATALLCALSLGTARAAQARGHFSLSIGIPFGYYGGGIYGGGYYGRGWYRTPYPYFEPRVFVPRPAYYSRPYARTYDGPIFSLGLFPAFVGDALNLNDRAVYFSAYQRALAAPVGEAMAWRSGNASGEVTTTRDGWAGPRYCREFSQSIAVDGAIQQALGTVCRTSDGEWQLVQSQ